MSEYLLSIDPGISTGVALLRYTDGTVPVAVQVWQFRGGAEGLNEWIESHTVKDDPEEPTLVSLPEWPNWHPATYLAEKFNPRGSGQGFSYTASSLEPLRCEGVLVAHGLPDVYAQPPQQYLAGGKNKADKKKRQHAALKDLGYYVTGKDVGCPDADDVRSALAHGLSFLARIGHVPTYEMLSEWNERNR